MRPIEREVWDSVQALNGEWTRGRVDALIGSFDADVLALTPTEPEVVEGRKACAEAWRRFAQRTEVEAWNAHDPQVRVHGGHTAVLTCTYELTFRTGGRPRLQHGRQTLVLLRDACAWRVLALEFAPHAAAVANGAAAAQGANGGANAAPSAAPATPATANAAPTAPAAAPAPDA